ncbi:MAG: hypothetical protein HY842_00720 [Bacteroidetes bacterium]|nr:hypothetical protein [Bacteroidota bacterium]
MRTGFFTLVVLLFSLLFSACKTPGASRPPVVKAGSGIRFEEEKLPSASPCAVCVAFSATTRYVRGNITWNICLSDQPKGYLDLQLSKANRTIKLRLLRDCSSPATVKVLRCPDESSDELIVNTVNYSEGHSEVSVVENGAAPPILKVTIPSSNQIGIELKTGWTLYYGKQSCTAGGN